MIDHVGGGCPFLAQLATLSPAVRPAVGADVEPAVCAIMGPAVGAAVRPDVGISPETGRRERVQDEHPSLDADQ